MNRQLAARVMPLKTDKEISLLGVDSTPPFEKPVVSQVVLVFSLVSLPLYSLLVRHFRAVHLRNQKILKNFYKYKYSRAPESRAQTLKKICGLFVSAVDKLMLPTPTTDRPDLQKDSVYLLNYQRFATTPQDSSSYSSTPTD